MPIGSFFAGAKNFAVDGANELWVDEIKRVWTAMDSDRVFVAPILSKQFDLDVYQTMVDAASSQQAFGGEYILTSFESEKPQTPLPATTDEAVAQIAQVESALSDVHAMMNMDYQLISKYQNNQLMEQKLYNFLLQIPRMITNEAWRIVRILDILAGRYQEKDIGEQLLKATKNLLDTIMGIVKYAVNIGFPEIPILGNLKDLIEELLLAQQIMSTIPEPARSQLEQNGDKVDFSAMVMDLLDKDLARLINRAAEDIKILMDNLRWLPFYLIAQLVLALLEAVTKIFDKLELDFSIEDFLPNIEMPRWKLDLQKIEEWAQDNAPPNNIISALIKAIKMFPAFISNFPTILNFSVLGMLYKLTQGVSFMDLFPTNADALLSGAYINLLSCQDIAGVLQNRAQLLREGLYLQKAKDDISVAQAKLEQEAAGTGPNVKPEVSEFRMDKANVAVTAARENFENSKKSMKLKFIAGAELVRRIDPERPNVSNYYVLQGGANASMVQQNMNEPLITDFGRTDKVLNDIKKQLGMRSKMSVDDIPPELMDASIYNDTRSWS